MSIQGNIHGALMAQVETITGYTVIWPRKGGDAPSGDYLTVYHLPNDNDRLFLNSDAPLGRKGFIIITLVSSLGQYQVVSEDEAGDIAEFFPNETKMTAGGSTVSVFNHSNKPAQEINGRWHTAVWVDYRGTA
jgi:hypothetical protein